MRFVLIISSMLIAISSMATLTMRFTSQDYDVEATFTKSEENPALGLVVAKMAGAPEGGCKGNFTLDLKNGLLKIEFEGQNSASHEGCHNESVDVDISAENFQKIVSGCPVEVTFRSQRFSRVERKANVSLVKG